MSNEIQTQNFFKFLSNIEMTNGKNWQDYVDGAYGNDDGEVIKYEFVQFLNKEGSAIQGWDGLSKSEKNDLINVFWKSMDTRESNGKYDNALSDEEMKNNEHNWEAYTVYTKFKENIYVPTQLQGTSFKNNIIERMDLIFESLISTTPTNKLKSVLMEKMTPIYIEESIISVAEYVMNNWSAILIGLNYDIKNDPALQALLVEQSNSVLNDPEFIKSFTKEDGTIDYAQLANTIISKIQIVVDNYMNTAIQKNGTATDGSATSGQAMNGIQIAVAEKAITEALLAKFAKDYEGFENELQIQINKYIQEILLSGLTFEEIMKDNCSVIVNNFDTTAIDNVVIIYNNFAKPKLTDENGEKTVFYQALIDRFGEGVAERIMKDGPFDEAYKNIIKDVLTKIADGSLTMDQVQEYIVKQINRKLNDILNNNYGDLDVEEIENVYNNRITYANEEQNLDIIFEVYKDSAKMVCAMLVAKGEYYEDLVKETFGAFYDLAINNMSLSDLETKIIELLKEAAKIEELSNYGINWSGIDNSLTMYFGGEMDGSIGETKITNTNGEEIKSGITYQASVIQGGAKISMTASGNYTITASNIEETCKIEIYAYVDGKKVGSPKVITIECVNDDLSLANINNDKKNKSHVTESWYVHDRKGAINDMLTGLKTFLAGLVSELKGKGFNGEKLNAASDAVMSFYTALCKGILDTGKKNNSTKSIDITYTDSNGNTVTSKNETYYSSCWFKTGTADNEANKALANMSFTTGLVLSKSYKDDDRWKLHLDYDAVLDKFIEFYNSCERGDYLVGDQTGDTTDNTSETGRGVNNGGNTGNGSNTGGVNNGGNTGGGGGVGEYEEVRVFEEDDRLWKEQPQDFEVERLR